MHPPLHTPAESTGAPAFDDVGAAKNGPKNELVLVFAVVVVIVLFILAYLLWGQLFPASFFGHSTNPNSGQEIDRIRQAIDRLHALGHPDSNRAFTELLGRERWYNADIFGGIRLNRQPPEEESLRGTVFKTVSKNIAIHQSLVNVPEWNEQSKRVLAVLLFAEWQHTDKPDWTEGQCQTWLEQWLQEVGWDDLNLPFHHGTNERAED